MIHEIDSWGFEPLTFGKLIKAAKNDVLLVLKYIIAQWPTPENKNGMPPFLKIVWLIFAVCLKPEMRFQVTQSVSKYKSYQQPLEYGQVVV